MRDRQAHYRGCLLGMAVGDALGYAIDDRNWEEIRRDYGPNGLLGYDLVNGYADVTSYTQLAAFACNGLLLGMTHGQMHGQMAPYVRYIRLSSREWAVGQRVYGCPEKSFCWLSHRRELRGRRCMDGRMLDTLIRDAVSSMEEPANKFVSPGALTVAIPVGLFFDPRRCSQSEIDLLGAEAVALTHGSPLAFLTGAAIAHMISRIVWDGMTDLVDLIQETLDALDNQFGRQYPQTREIRRLVEQAAAYTIDPDVSAVEALNRLGCDSAPEVLAGAIYACLVCRGNFDTAMVISVNHSGRSSAVGALTGAILGAFRGERILPDFYLECLEPQQILRELADDMFQGCPMDRTSRLYDDDWDRKYIHYGIE